MSNQEIKHFVPERTFALRKILKDLDPSGDGEKKLVKFFLRNAN